MNLKMEALRSLPQEESTPVAALSRSIHELPHEILVSIFSYLKPSELLYGVSMVCKRWCELSKEPLAWQKSVYCLWDDTRIWRHAPFIGHLEILAPKETEVEKVRQLVTSTGPTCVRSMRIILRHPKDALGILRKYEQVIRTLDLQVGGQDALPEDWHEFFDTIGMVSDLRSLSIRISPVLPDIPYNKQISAGCRALRSLRVRGQEGLAADLVCDLGAVVSSLVLSCSFNERSHKVIQALSTCTAVRELTLPCCMIASVSHLMSLQSLKLIADHGPANIDDAVLAASLTLEKIEKLEICNSRSQRSPELNLNRCVSVVARHLKKCHSVNLRGLRPLDEYLSDFIHEAKGVQSYEIICKVYHLLQLEQLENVRSVRAGLDTQGMGVPFVMNTINRLMAHPEKTFYLYFLNVPMFYLKLAL